MRKQLMILFLSAVTVFIVGCTRRCDYCKQEKLFTKTSSESIPLVGSVTITICSDCAKEYEVSDALTKGFMSLLPLID